MVVNKLWRILAAVLLCCWNALGRTTAFQDTVALRVTPGWNLISLPVIPSDPRCSVLFSSATTPAYYYNNLYLTADSLKVGRGYWIKFPSPETLSIVGAPLTDLTISLNADWNMIGGPGSLLDSSLVTATPVSSRTSAFYGYSRSAGYIPVAQLEPGKGYWVKSAHPGTAYAGCWAPVDKILLSPVNDSSLMTEPVLRWRKSRCSSLYRLQVSGDSLFSAILLDTLIADTTYIWQFNCKQEQHYFRVGIDGVHGGTNFSVARHFTWGYYKDWLVFPVSGQDVSLTPRLQWRQSLCGGPYRIEIAEDSLFNSVLKDTTTNDTTYQSDSLTVARDYYWRMSWRAATGDTIRTAVMNYHTAMWEYLGLATEQVSGLAFDRTDSTVIYAGSLSGFPSTLGGIFKSTDSGISWDTLLRGVSAKSIKVDPQNPHIVFAALIMNGATPYPGLIRSTDGGQSWVKSDSGMNVTAETYPFNVEFNPEHSDTIFGSTNGFFEGNFYRSVDSGKFWSTLPFIGSPTDFVLEEQGSTRIFAVRGYSGEFYVSLDGGSSWNNIQTPRPATSVRLKHTMPSSLALGTRRGLFYSLDDGATWKKAKSQLSDTLWYELCPRERFDSELIYATASNSGQSETGGGLVSSDGGVSWIMLPEKNGGGIYSIFQSFTGEILGIGSPGLFRLHR